MSVNFCWVTVPPDIVYEETSADMSIQEGENGTLVCKAGGHPSPRITWRREDGQPVLLRKSRTEMYRGKFLFYSLQGN